MNYEVISYTWLKNKLNTAIQIMFGLQKKGKKNSGTQNLLENTLKLERIIAFMQNNEKGKYVHTKYQSLPPQWSNDMIII